MSPKRRMRVGVLLIAAAAVGCGPSPTEVPLGTEFALPYGHTAAVATTGITITFTKLVEDSRCPLGVLCIQAGNGRIEVLVGRRGETITVALNTTSGPHDGTAFGYTIRLVSLEPIPRRSVTTTPAGYRATLNVFVAGGSQLE